MTWTEVAQVGAAVIASVGGAGVILLGVSGFLGKVWAERILESDRRRFADELERAKAELERATRRLQTSLDHLVTVNRAQFEAEFATLQVVWAAVSNLRRTLLAVRPTASIVPVDDTKDAKLERLSQRIQAFSTAHDALLAAVDDRSPFYPMEIFEALDALLKESNTELTLVQTDEPFTLGWFREGREANLRVRQLCSQVSDRIRERLASLKVVETS